METVQDKERLLRRRRGQTLAEFAITLPILLVLMFGVIEFGRVFQAWVTLQNAARQAARYASTGNYDTAAYTMNLELDSTTPADPTGLIPCVNDGYTASLAQQKDGTGKLVYNYPSPGNGATIDTDQRGTKSTYNGVNIYQGGLESLFATWSGGLNCDPYNQDHQDMRRDMARILSIVSQARLGAAGLALEQNYLTVPADKLSPAGQPWYEAWKVPQPRSTQRQWFNVVICSTRKMLDTDTVRPPSSYYTRVASPQNIVETGRFVTYLGDSTLRDPAGNDLNTTTTPKLPSPACLLNEVPDTTKTEMLQNASVPWLDPGGPNDTVTVIVSFNHPLITPFALTQYIPMQARRSAIVESFRNVNPRTALGSGGAIQLPPTATPTNTSTSTLTYTPSATSTKTNTPTLTPSVPPAEPFKCERITFGDLNLSGGQLFLQINNGNQLDSTYITRVVLTWPSIAGYTSMALVQMALNLAPHWAGRDVSDPHPSLNTTDTNADTYLSTRSDELDRMIDPSNSGSWTATFSSGPARMENYLSASNFALRFEFYDPIHPTVPCVKQVPITPPTVTPTVNPNQTNTATYTPDCASSLISVRFIAFEPFGIVHLEVRNARRTVAPLTNFRIQWVQRAPGILTLDRVTAVAPYGETTSAEIWNSGGPLQDALPPTLGKSDVSNPGGVWVQNYNFDAGTAAGPSVTGLYLDFGGVTGLLSDLGMTPSDFNGTSFDLGCGLSGGGGGPGGPGNGGTITLSELPTPTTPPTQGPTRTPAPTLTPSNTQPSPTPSRTPTPGPTNTPKPPTNTPTKTLTPTNPPPPTPPGGGCVDGCG